MTGPGRVERGEIVVMVAPGDLGKPRPAVVVQADEFGEGTTTVLVCPMSSEVRQSTHISLSWSRKPKMGCELPPKSGRIKCPSCAATVSAVYSAIWMLPRKMLSTARC